MKAVAYEAQQARRQRAVASGSRWLRWPENAIFRFGQTQIAADNPSKQRVAGSIPVSRSRLVRPSSKFFAQAREIMTNPVTHYARSGDVNIAYQVVGEGPKDLVLVPGWVSHLELSWECPSLKRFLDRLASFSRLVFFDKRGTGLSDRVPVNELPTLEQRMDDVRAVMDAVRSERASLFGISEGGPMCALFAATYPDRAVSLIMYGSYARRLKDDDYPWGPDPETRQKFFDAIEEGWGGVVDLADLAPSVANDAEFAKWWAAYLRMGASPGAALALAKMNSEVDIRHVLPAIRVPTLILHRTDDIDMDVGGGRYLGEQIPNTRYVELPGVDHLPWVGDQDAILDEVEGFLTGAISRPEPDRILATVLFTDIVDSTSRSAEVGDRRWRELLEVHGGIVDRQLKTWRGRLIKGTGDGILATFDGPGRAIQCAASICQDVRDVGLEIRAGLHTGECELLGDDISGISVNVAARVAAIAQANEVLVSRTVKDLVAGSGIEFQPRGKHRLKGVPGSWNLYAVTQK
jgi:pimeloyl-ACP methyl ester carboxylesterase